MFKLIKNELFKILHKKSTYIVIIITALFMVLVSFIMSKNNIYYSIFCPQCDYINSDLLSEIRYNFFVYNKRQKNKITREIDGEIYHYSYVLEKDKPLRWKYMLKDKLLEKVK